MTQTLKTSERLGVVDALRGFALLAIVLLHNLEHYNLFLVPENVPAWLQTIKGGKTKRVNMWSV